MEDLVNMSLSDVILKEKANRKQAKKQEGHVKAKPKQHDKPRKATNQKQEHAKGRQDSRPQKPISDENKKRLLVKGLASEAANSDLFSYFSKFGTLTRCGIIWDKLGTSKGIAIVQFEEPAVAATALKESNGAELKGQAMEVAWA
jgi:RNA recognition motif-containing protein